MTQTQPSDPCREALEQLYTFIDGELTIERRTNIRVHLDECSGCLGAFDFEVELRQIIMKRCQERVPDALRDRILAALQED